MPRAASLPAQLESESVTSERYRFVRGTTESLCEPLPIEDYGAQSMPDASPTKWHLAHTSWFFETFVLKSWPHYKPFDPRFEVLFNSYYNSVGEQFPRPQRGLLTRPTVEEVYRYRHRIDEEIATLLDRGDLSATTLAVLELGLHHEQQHQELMLTDLKHLLSCNPLRPVYRLSTGPAHSNPSPPEWIEFEAGIFEIGHSGQGFAFDNEGPRHRIFCESFALASQLVTNRDMLRFIDDGGYRRPELWLSEGWDMVRTQGWQAPLYWELIDGKWRVYTLGGMHSPGPNEPVCHVSYFEADALARWSKARLPREGEWEVAASRVDVAGNFVESKELHPRQSSGGPRRSMQQMFGDVWEWTESPYVAYPGFQSAAGALGEYNGKFMCNQFVLRGGSCLTPSSHMRATYRNFFPAAARWQCSGIRLARDE